MGRARVRDDFAVVVARVKRRARARSPPRRATRRASRWDTTARPPRRARPTCSVRRTPARPRARRAARAASRVHPGRFGEKHPPASKASTNADAAGTCPPAPTASGPSRRGRSHRGDVDVRLAEHELAVRVDAERRQGVRRVRRALKRKLNLGGFAVEPAPRSRRRILLAQQHVLRRRGASHAEEQDAVRGVGAIVEGDFVPAEEPTRAALRWSRRRPARTWCSSWSSPPPRRDPPRRAWWSLSTRPGSGRGTWRTGCLPW